jgi:NTP pyrophosphatase (non-canonical NTP hydrolase)
MNYLIKKNYESIVARGLISPSTSISDFVMKMEEELQEFIDATKFESESNQREELADIVLVCFNIAENFGWDIESELFRKVEINEQRAKEIIENE